MKIGDIPANAEVFTADEATDKMAAEQAEWCFANGWGDYIEPINA